jgi:hypothetical protein
MATKTSARNGRQAARHGDIGKIPESLRIEYAQQQALFQSQSAITQRFLEAEAQALADAIVSQASQVRFRLPSEVVTQPGSDQTVSLVQGTREQLAGGLLDSLTHPDVRTALRNRLLEMESSNDTGLAVSAALIRYATASHLVNRILPSGRAVRYAAVEGEEIPTIPFRSADEPGSAITAETDAIVEDGPRDAERGDLPVPYVPAARHFYLPQWVAFDDQSHLLSGSVHEAEGHIASMQQFVAVLHMAVGLAPYMVADEEYQRKRYGILGQLANQGRALARYQTNQIIETIQQRAASGDLNRGLSLGLPYFDDQELVMKLYNFLVIPSGRIMFIPGFVTRAAREEQAKVAQDTRLSASMRKYLLQQLDLLAQAFEGA